MRDSQGLNARSTNFATGAPLREKSTEKMNYMNSTGNSQTFLKDKSPVQVS